MNDIRPPKRIQRPPGVIPASVAPNPTLQARPQPGKVSSGSSFRAGAMAGKSTLGAAIPPSSDTSGAALPPLGVPKKRSKLKVFLWSVGIVLLLTIGLGAGVFGWYTLSLEPVSAGSDSRTRVEIVSGTSPSEIGRLLEEKKLIRSRHAFEIYLRVSEKTNKLQAGTYSLSASESTPAIVDHIVAGKVDQFSITFLPGATLAQNRAGLLSAGYSDAEVDAALKKKYDHPLFESKPEGADLEGYIYGETYKFSSSASVEEVLLKTFDHYYKIIAENKLIDAFKVKGLNLYEGITLASIIQREVPSAKDQKQVAQVFFSRMSIGMMLGSDVTYQYAAKKLGVPPTPSLDSPYNTRRYAGLPPGPIATPGLTALQAVASPAAGDYLYFLSGDDDITYFARTDAEHEANIRNHCQKKCLIL